MVGLFKFHARIRWTTLVLVLGLVLAACGGAPSTPTPPAAPTSAPTATASPDEATPEETTAPETEEPEETEEAVETPTDAPAEEVTDEATVDAAATGEGDAEATSGATVSVTQINTALRSGPGTAYEIVTRTAVSDTFPVLARFGEGSSLWYQITLDDGTSAWVWARVATLNPPDAEVPVAEDVPPAP